MTALMEGTRPVLVEVQALAAKSGYGTPQRVATGHRSQAARRAARGARAPGARRSFAELDVFVQVTAGVRLTEPGADLAVAAALLSSLYNRPRRPTSIFLGEIGLGGEIRPERRPRAASGGGGAARLPPGVRLVAAAPAQVPGVSLVGLDHVEQLVRALAA